MTHHAAAERRELARTLREVGPDAPTLCPPWTAAELAAHLVLRGSSLRYAVQLRRDDAAALRSQQELVASVGYDELVDRVERIARFSPARLGAIDDAVNLIEYVVHHEDIRRAQDDWEPRALPADRVAALWTHLSRATRTVFRSALKGRQLRWAATGQRIGSADAPVVVSGDPVELTLTALGRTQFAAVQVTDEARGDAPRDQ